VAGIPQRPSDIEGHAAPPLNGAARSIDIVDEVSIGGGATLNCPSARRRARSPAQPAISCSRLRHRTAAQLTGPAIDVIAMAITSSAT
jgi:hypothetical protein